jgi:hypothetical protein
MAWAAELRRAVAGVVVLTWAGMASAALADTVVLKDGTVLEGEIIEETASRVTMRVELAGGTITQTRALSKSDIAEVRRWSPEDRRLKEMQRDYERLKPLQLHSQSNYRLEDYDWVIRDRLRPFVERYGDMEKGPEIAALLQAWIEEREKVASGMVKRRGVWMSVEEAQRQSEQQQTDKLVAEARSLLDRGNYGLALQQLQEVGRITRQPELIAQAREVQTEIYARWYPMLEERREQLRGEISALENQVRRAEDRRRNAHSRLSQQGLGQRREFGRASGSGSARELQEAVLELSRLEPHLARLKREQEFVERVTRYVENYAPELGVTRVVTRVKEERQAKQQASASGQPARQPARETPSMPGILADIAWYWERYWAVMGGVALLGLVLLWRYVR